MNKFHISITVLITLFLQSCNHTNEKMINYIDIGYYSTVYEADSLYLEKNYSKSFKLLDELFQKAEPQNMDIYYEYKTYVQSAYIVGDYDKAKKGLEKLIVDFGTTWRQMQNDSILNLIAKEAKIDNLKFDKLENKHKKKVNYSLRNDIISMRTKDQLYRNRNYQKNAHLQDSIDEIHEQKLIGIFETVGYPNVTVVGKNGIPPNNADIKTILLHTSDSIRKKYFLPKILEFIQRGKCDPLRYGTMYDQLMLYNKKKQKYGTYANGRKVQSEDSLDYYRKSIGLPRFGYEEWRSVKKYGKRFY